MKVKASSKLYGLADGVLLRGTVTIKSLRAALRVIAIEENLGKGIHPKDAVEIQPAPLAVTVGKNQREGIAVPAG